MEGPRRLALVLAVCSYAAVFGAFVVFERSGLGLGHFFYIPICLVALATDAFVGAGAGILAALIYMLAVQAAPHVISAPLTPSTAIRAVTFTMVGALVGFVAGRNRALVEQLRGHASTDFVTGVGNVRAFDEELERRCASGSSFALVLVDVDDLRRVNEVHGHAAGDAALRKVAKAIVAWAPVGDSVARIGSDEFALLTTADVPELVGRLNTTLAASDLSVTTAATAFPADGVIPDGLLRKAEDRLFAAKLVGSRRRIRAVV
jgi:diguanylate cyclase (GGDEF)-like protein